MRLPAAAVAALAAVAARAAPALPDGPGHAPDPAAALDAVSEYFNLVAAMVPAARLRGGPPACDLSRAQMPRGELPAGHRRGAPLTAQASPASSPRAPA